MDPKKDIHLVIILKHRSHGMDHRDIKEIRVYNQQGVLIDQPFDFSPSGKNTWIRTGDWPTGLYYISVQMPDQVITQPITIIR